MINEQATQRASLGDWKIFQRRQEVGAELRVACIRIVAVITFYVVHLSSYMSAEQPGADWTVYHQRISLICGVWCLISVAVFVHLYFRSFPTWTKFLTTGADILLLTAAAVINAGANSHELMIFPMIVAATGLRFSKTLICFATVLSLAGYIMLVGKTDTVWFDENHQVPTVELLITVTCIALAGVIAWQIASQVKRAITPV